MEMVWEQIKATLLDANITIADIPLSKTIAIATILILTQLLRGLFLWLVITRIKNLTSQTNTTLDDEDAIRNLPKSIDSLNDQCAVWLDRFEQNARVINIRVFNNNLDLYNSSCEKLNLAILALLEEEGIDPLHVEFRTHLSKFSINTQAPFAGIMDAVQ